MIGGGVIGLTTVYELSKRGAQVTVIEECEPGWAASHGNAGTIYPSSGEPMINPHHVTTGIRWMLTRSICMSNTKPTVSSTRSVPVAFSLPSSRRKSSTVQRFSKAPGNHRSEGQIRCSSGKCQSHR